MMKLCRPLRMYKKTEWDEDSEHNWDSVSTKINVSFDGDKIANFNGTRFLPRFGARPSSLAAVDIPAVTWSLRGGANIGVNRGVGGFLERTHTIRYSIEGIVYEK